MHVCIIYDGNGSVLSRSPSSFHVESWMSRLTTLLFVLPFSLQVSFFFFFFYIPGTLLSGLVHLNITRLAFTASLVEELHPTALLLSQEL